jgi:hypothetical protein
VPPPAVEEGLCTECGDRIVWERVLSEEFRRPRWLFEHADTPLRLAVAVPSTLLAACVPLYLWRRLRMEHPIRPRRLLLLVVLLALTMHLVVATSTAAMMLWQSVSQPGRNVSATVGNISINGSYEMPVLQATLLVLLYPYRDFVPCTAEFVPRDAYDNLRRTRVSIPSGFAMPPMPTLVEVPRSRRFGLGAQMRILDIVVVSAVASTISFAALPIARRRAKVRWAHIARAAVYLVCGSTLIMIGACNIFTRSSIVPLAIVAAYCVWFWHATASRYLRMSRPGAVAMSVTAIGMTAAMLFATITTLAAHTFVGHGWRVSGPSTWFLHR